MSNNEIPQFSCLFIKIAFLLPIDLQGLLYLKSTRNDPPPGGTYTGADAEALVHVNAGCGSRLVTVVGGVHSARALMQHAWELTQSPSAQGGGTDAVLMRRAWAST